MSLMKNTVESREIPGKVAWNPEKSKSIPAERKAFSSTGSAAETQGVITVVLADDHPHVRAGIRAMLRSANGIQVVGEAENGAQALNLVEQLCPDILLLDMEMPVMNGSQVATELQRTGSLVRILALSAYSDAHFITGLLQAGASGYLMKDEAPEFLVKAIRSIAKGKEGWVSTRVTQDAIQPIMQGVRERLTLTQRELQILRLLAAKKTDGDISESLGIPATTVKRHLHLLSAKFQVQSRSELSMRAVQEKYV